MMRNEVASRLAPRQPAGHDRGLAHALPAGEEHLAIYPVGHQPSIELGDHGVSSQEAMVQLSLGTLVHTPSRGLVEPAPACLHSSSCSPHWPHKSSPRLIPFESAIH